MQYAQGGLGRVFVLRLEDGDRIPDVLEDFARDQGLDMGLCALIGGAGSGKLVTGPKDGDATTITPLLTALDAVHEAAAVGTIFPDEQGQPKLHMHGAFGRDGRTKTGCVRQGVDIWKLAEVVIIEIVDAPMHRAVDPAFGFEVLCRKDQV